MSVLIVLEPPIPPENVEAAKEIFAKEILPTTRAYEGNEGMFVHTGEDGQIMVTQRWASRDAFDRYFAWRIAQTEQTGRMDALLVGPRPTPRFYEVIDI